MLRTFIVAAVTAVTLALATSKSDINVTHSNLEVHIDKYEIKYGKADKKVNSIQLLGDEITHERFTAEEKEIICRIAEAEATDGTKEQKKNVMTCVMNRVLSTGFPNTIKEVVFEPDQFTPIKDGRYYQVTIQSSTYEAYEEWLDDCDEGNVHDCLFFCTPYAAAHSTFFKSMEVSFPDGMHYYYRGDKK